VSSRGYRIRHGSIMPGQRSGRELNIELLLTTLTKLKLDKLEKEIGRESDLFY